MSIQALETLWGNLQEKKLETLGTWEPSGDLLSSNNLADFRGLLDALNNEMSAVYDVADIHALEQEIARLESTLSPEDFRTWNLGRVARARTDGEAQAQVSSAKMMKLLGL